jgi:hypothetical protein
MLFVLWFMNWEECGRTLLRSNEVLFRYVASEVTGIELDDKGSEASVSLFIVSKLAVEDTLPLVSGYRV